MKGATAGVAKEKGELAARTAGKVSYTNATVHGDGSVAFLLQTWAKDGFITTTASVAAPYLFVSRLAWKVLGCYAAFELLLMRVLPGQMRPVRPVLRVTSCVPTAYCVALATFGLLTYLGVSTLGLSTTIWERSSELSISLQSSCAGCCTLKASTYRQTPMQVYQVI